MAKIYGINGVITGKLGAAVYAVRNGEQISRQYQPVVSNPSTASQVAARAKLKLMSQLSAVMAPYIAIPRQGAVSSRNMFVKQNYSLASYTSNTASVDLNSVQLTKSVVGLPEVTVSRTETALSLRLSGRAEGLDRVVYVIFTKGSDNKLRFASSVVSTTPETPGTGNFVAEAPLVNDEVVVYAYGIRDNTEAARTRFGDMTTVSAEVVAKLVTTRVLLESDITLTETRAATLIAAA